MNKEDDRDPNAYRRRQSLVASMIAQGRSFSGRERNCCFLNTLANPAANGRFANISAIRIRDAIETVARILANIERSKQKPLPRLLFALGIIHVGSEVAELLTQAYNSVEEIAAATEVELAEIPGIGPKIAASIASYFQVDASQAVIEKLRAAGVNLKQEPRQVETAVLPLPGKTFVVTGTLSGFSRRESESRIKDLGGKITTSVTKNTDYVVVGESPGSKLAAAERLGTEILDEDAFVDLLANPPVEPGS